MVETTEVAADWNVIVTLPEATFREARKFLRRWGEVYRTGYFHVLTLTVDDIEGFLEEVAKAIEEKPGTFNILSHIIPAQRTFTFASAEEFEAKARDIAILWAPMLAGKSFHVRLHRRGFNVDAKGRAVSRRNAARRIGDPGQPRPDHLHRSRAILQIETIDGRAGVSLWQREDLQRYPFLGVS
jgi:tRNA(Ser,Leu) C12 N-acetylase TAN1